jgi:hypothetical protein
MGKATGSEGVRLLQLLLFNLDYSKKKKIKILIMKVMKV